jgi:2-dehydro-3-deoxyphosphogluconate aldolase/(4S)-4-hydroxy-2-oxoglutarate aldolase
MRKHYSIEDILTQAAPVMPVISLERLSDALPVAKALVAQGFTVIEVTLRSSIAMEVIKIMQSVEGAIVGAGTVVNVQQMEELQQIGADFIVSPGATPALLSAGQHSSIPYLPAIATPAEIMLGMDMGYRYFKFFPASIYGGLAALKAFSGPFPDISFCPTGGINSDNYQDYLALANVSCVGGSWLTPGDLIANKDWPAIESLAARIVR